MRARGLKHQVLNLLISLNMSRPMRARGLKRGADTKYKILINVAPHAGAWVETIRIRGTASSLCRTPCGRVD